MRFVNLLPTSAAIGHVELRVSDRERALAFYRDLLGFRVIDCAGAAVRLSPTGAEPARLVLRTDARFRPRPPRTAGLYHVAILLPSRPALGAALRRLTEARYPLDGGADHLVSEAVYLEDPESNGIELYVDRPRSRWEWEGDQVAMDTLPLDFAGLLALADAEAPGLPAETRIGHVHLSVGRLDRAEAFYHAGLGMNVTARSYPGALFFAAPGYHHHVGANTWQSRNGPPTPPDCVGLEAFSVEVPSADALTPVAKGLTQGGWEVRPIPGGLESTDADGIRVQVLVADERHDQEE